MLFFSSALVALAILFCFVLRSSLSQVFCKKRVLKNFTKFTGKNQCQSLFFDKVANLRPAILLKKKKKIWHRCFPVNFVKFLRTPFFIEHLWWLLLRLLSLVLPSFIYLDKPHIFKQERK